MGLADTFDNIKDTISEKWSEFQETTLYTNIREKYDNLTPAAQKALKGVGGAVIVGMVLLFVYGLFSDSGVYVQEFNEKKQTIRELLKLKRDIAQVPRSQPPPPIESLKSRIDSTLSSFSLAPTQIAEVTASELKDDPSSTLIPSSVTQKGVLISLKQLNLKQVVDIGYRLQGLHAAVKLASMDMQATTKDPHYYDVTYSVVGYYPPPVEEEADQNKAPKRKNRRKRK